MSIRTHHWSWRCRSIIFSPTHTWLIYLISCWIPSPFIKISSKLYVNLYLQLTSKFVHKFGIADRYLKTVLTYFIEINQVVTLFNLFAPINNFYSHLLTCFKRVMHDRIWEIKKYTWFRELCRQALECVCIFVVELSVWVRKQCNYVHLRRRKSRRHPWPGEMTMNNSSRRERENLAKDRNLVGDMKQERARDGRHTWHQKTEWETYGIKKMGMTTRFLLGRDDICSPPSPPFSILPRYQFPWFWCFQHCKIIYIIYD